MRIDDTEALTWEALELAPAGTRLPMIAQTFPQERASDAHAAIESRASLGKTLTALFALYAAQLEP